MGKCIICNSRKGKRACLALDGKLICSLCCGKYRSWEKCITTCNYFPQEEGPAFYCFLPSLRNESTGETTRFVANYFLPNIYEFVKCIVKKVNYQFLDSHSVKIELIIKLESNRNIFKECFIKDNWKKKENWGPYDHCYNLFPVIFIFAGYKSTFPPLSTIVRIDGKEAKINSSLIHWNIWMPFSKICLESKRKYNSKIKRFEEISYRVCHGKYLMGKNNAIFSELMLNKEIKIESIIRFQEINHVLNDKCISINVGLFLPFKEIEYTNINFIPPPGFSFKNKPNINIVAPKVGKMEQETFIPITSENEKVLIFEEADSSKYEIFDDYIKTNDFFMLNSHIDLVPKISIEAISFVTSLPIPSSIYNSINKLYREQFSPAKVIVSNFSDSPAKVSIEGCIQGFSHILEKDIIIKPWNQSELKVNPILNQELIKNLYEITETALSIKAIFEDKVILRSNTPIKLLARDTIIWEVEDPGLSWKINLWDLVVAWITPHIPKIDEIISKAARKVGKILGFLAYKYGNEVIMKEVKAIYEVLSQEEIVYVNRSFSFGSDINSLTQRILTPSQTLKQKSGNCIDLSVLFASCLENCGILPLIALVPGHAFVGWKGANGEFFFVEATMIGTHSFECAMVEGQKNYKKYFSDGQKYEIDSRIIEVNLVRQKGVYPLGF